VLESVGGAVLDASLAATDPVTGRVIAYGVGRVREGRTTAASEAPPAAAGRFGAWRNECNAEWYSLELVRQHRPSRGDPLDAPPVSSERIQYLEPLSGFYADALHAYSSSRQNRSGFCALRAAILAAIATQSIWATLRDNPSGWSQAVVSGISIATSIVSLVPKIRDYVADIATARKLGFENGKIFGGIMDLRVRIATVQDFSCDPLMQACARPSRSLRSTSCERMEIRSPPRAPKALTDRHGGRP
jgi:hypothetical protein